MTGCTIENTWDIPGGLLELAVHSNEPLPAEAWSELAAVMQVAQGLAYRINALAPVSPASPSSPPTASRWMVEEDDDSTTVLQKAVPS